MSSIMALTISPRNTNAPKVQEILTKHGCIIKTRLGLHEVSTGDCSQEGLVILHISGTDEETEALSKELSTLADVKVNYMKI